MESASYSEWFNSAYYNKLYTVRDSAAAEDFVLQLLSRLQPKTGSRILEVACGKGTISGLMNERGFDVSAIDIAVDNIAAAKKKENDRLHFYLHDIRLPFWGNYFDYGFNFFTRFGYFRTRREHDAAIRTITSSLKPGGIFVIDYLNVHYMEDHPVHTETKNIGTTTYEIQRWNDALNFYKKITITDPALSKPLEYTERLAKFSLGDFTDMLSFQGLQVQEVYGDYDFQSYDIRKTPRLIILARKALGEAGDKEKRLYSDGRKTDALT